MHFSLLESKEKSGIKHILICRNIFFLTLFVVSTQCRRLSVCLRASVMISKALKHENNKIIIIIIIIINGGFFFRLYEGVSINNQPVPFPMDRDVHDFHALFQYMFYTWVQNCTRIESFFNKILNVKYG